MVGNSFGASIALRLACEHARFVRGLIAHEPPLFSLLANDSSLTPLLRDVQREIRVVIERIASGDHAGATAQFVETVALGPGAWATVPPDTQQTMIENAPTFLDEANDPEQIAFEPEWISDFSKPILFTLGGQSPPAFAPVVAKLSQAVPPRRLSNCRRLATFRTQHIRGPMSRRSLISCVSTPNDMRPL